MFCVKKTLANSPIGELANYLRVMCGRYVLIRKIEAYEVRFNATVIRNPAVMLPNFNVVPGALAPVITNQDPNHIQFFRFGLTPFWAKKPMYLINARSEGDHNSGDDPNYTGAKGIISKPSFRKPIRSQRCLIPADFFIEGTVKEKLDKPFLVYLKESPFAMAGIWDEWVNPETGEVINSFAIITAASNRLLQKLPHHRSPVILHKSDEAKWLNSDAPLSEITSLLEPYPAEEMNAYPIDPRIKNPRSNDLQLLAPVGDSVVPDTELRVAHELKLIGMKF